MDKTNSGMETYYDVENPIYINSDRLQIKIKDQDVNEAVSNMDRVVKITTISLLVAYVACLGIFITWINLTSREDMFEFLKDVILLEGGLFTHLSSCIQLIVIYTALRKFFTRSPKTSFFGNS